MQESETISSWRRKYKQTCTKKQEGNWKLQLDKVKREPEKLSKEQKEMVEEEKW